jgi:dolichyl-phosphate-mannose-protein mannosyltransferase
LTFIAAIPYFAEITVKHQETKSFLHSHKDTYPLKYEDGRVSSKGQQVTAYPHNDKNNKWQIVPLNTTLYPVADEYIPTAEETERNVRYLRHDDIVRLRHVSTNSFLLTHDVASPLTTTNMEVTTYLEAVNQTQPQRYNDTLWRVVVTDGKPGEKVKSRRSYVKLINVQHKVAIHTLKTAKLPEWGFGQQEVNGNKKENEKSTVWFIEDVEHERIVNGMY